MNEFSTLLPVNAETPERLTVSARDLHTALEVATSYSHWFSRMCEYGFEEGRDFNPVKNDRVQIEGTRQVKRMVDDAQITIDMAKELCMLQRNERGKQARRYFIQIEKEWNSPEKVMARALQIANDKLKVLAEKIEADAPAVRFADAITGAETNILVRDLAKLLSQNGFKIGGNRLYELLRNDGYLIKQGSDRNMPMQYSMERGLFFVKETPRMTREKTVIDRVVRVTPKGQQYFINRYAGEKIPQ